MNLSDYRPKKGGSLSQIMVIEDNDEIRSALSYLLKLEGYDVVTAHDGLSALEELKKDSTRPSLIFLDLMMPGMGGIEFYEKLKENNSLSSIPVVVLSCLNPATENLQSLGPVDFLTKPVNMDTLLGYAKKYCATA